VSLGNYWGNEALDFLLNGRTVWVSLHTANPGATGQVSTEVSGASYERLECDFTVPSSKTSLNDIVLEWDNMPTAKVTHAGVWDAEFGGNIIAFGPLSSPEQVFYTQTFVIPAGDLAISI